MIRRSYEYEQLIYFMKRKRGMDHCGVHPNLSLKNGFRIELHHTPFCLEDIVHIVIKKRLDKGQSLKMGDIVSEVMELHYLGLVGLYPLCMLCHAYAHPQGDHAGNDLFIPIANVSGNPEAFYDMYKDHATESIRTKYENIQQLNRGYNLIEANIPQELMRKYIYIKPKGQDGDDNEHLEVISTKKLVTFIRDLNAS
ncbi:MAG: hypothetical protein NC311_05635 [Muribaculaceae bacterium]|nr:hypothetical protein [Muribaculaceae bacterium]